MWAQSCPTLCDPMDSIPPGSTVHAIFQARILEWVAISYSGGCSPPRNLTASPASPAWQADYLPLHHLLNRSRYLFGFVADLTKERLLEILKGLMNCATWEPETVNVIELEKINKGKDIGSSQYKKARGQE